jgi:branched-chain amino acid transport system substrate-binding protein
VIHSWLSGKGLVGSLAGLVLVAASAACGSGPAQSGSKPDIKVGVILPLSGANAQSGNDIMSGINLYVDEVNKAGGLLGGRKLALSIEDDASTPSSGVSAAQLLINDQKVVAIVGPYNSPVCAAVQQVAERAKVPDITTSCALDSLTQGGFKYFFRPSILNSQQGTAISDYLVNSLGKKRGAMLFQNDSFGQGLDQIITQQFVKYGAQIVDHQGYAPGTTDFRSTLTKIASDHVDVIITPALITEASIILRQAADLGIPPTTFYGLSTWDDPSMVKLANGKQVGAYFVTPYSTKDTTNPTGQEFASRYQAQLNKVASQSPAQGYTAMTMLAAGLKKANTDDPVALRNALAGLKNVATPEGTLTFDANNQAQGLHLVLEQWGADTPAVIKVLVAGGG